MKIYIYISHPFSKLLKSRCQKISRIRRQIKKIDLFYFTKQTLTVNYFRKQMNIQIKSSSEAPFLRQIISFMLSTQGASPGYTVHTCINFSKLPSPLPHHLFTTSEMVGPTDRGKHAYFISFVTQHMLHVSVTDALYLHKELCHLNRINENKY